MKFSVNKILFAAIAILALTFIIILFISVGQSKQVKDTSKSASQTEETLLHLQKLVFAVLENETGARGYVITGKEVFLEPLLKSEQDIRNEQEILLTMANDEKTSRLLKDSIALYIRQRLDFSNLMIRIYRDKGRDAAAELVLTGRGKEYTDKIRFIVDEITQEVNNRLAVIKKSNDNSINKSNFILYTVIGVSFFLSIILVQRISSGVQKQKHNEQKFSALLDAAPDATVIVNNEGIIQMVNLQAENIFGYSKKEMAGQPVEILIPQDLRTRHEHHRNGFIKEAKMRPMGAGIELRAVKKGGSSFPVEISLSPIQTASGLLISASVRDITVRKKAEEKFRSLLDSAPDATVIVNNDGIIQMINHQTESLFGYSKEEIIGKPVEILVPADKRNKHIHHRGNFAKSPKVRTMGAGIELNAVKKNGMLFPVEISLSPIDTEEGMLVSASVRDITLRKELESELKKSNAEMEAFTYSVSHDLRAPLRGIIGFTAILEEDYTGKLDDEARRITSIIKSNTIKMGLLIDDLLAFSRTGKQEIMKTQVNSKAIVNEAIEELKQQNQNNITWDIRSLPSVNADIHTIRQVWINLISNAIKYSGIRENPRIEIGSYLENGQTVFYVKDNGVGFDDQYKHKLFKVFQRLHSADEFEGTGVGLALVEKIVSKHGGKVWAEGKEDEGACFYFSLPV